MAKVSGIGAEKILNVAEAIISAKGIKETSLKDIAKAAGVSKGTLYYHFSTKEALICDIAGRYFDTVGEKLLKWFEGIGRKASGQDIMAVLFETIMYDRKDMGRLHLYLIQEALENEIIRNKFLERYSEWKSMFAKMLDVVFGVNRELNIMFADIILALTEGYLIRMQVDEEKVDFKKLAQNVAKLYNAAEVECAVYGDIKDCINGSENENENCKNGRENNGGGNNGDENNGDNQSI